MNIENFVTIGYLESLGFTKDFDAAERGIERWKHSKYGNHHISITLDYDGEKYVTSYGFFHSVDGHNRIKRKYTFVNELLTIDEFCAIVIDVFNPNIPLKINTGFNLFNFFRF